MPKRTPKSPGNRQPATARLSITIPAEDYADIKTTATRQRVSIAWVVRDAINQYLRNQAPLFRS